LKFVRQHLESTVGRSSAENWCNMVIFTMIIFVLSTLYFVCCTHI